MRGLQSTRPTDPLEFGKVSKRRYDTAMAMYPRLSAVTILGMVLVTLLWSLCFPLIVTGALHAPSPLLFAALRALLAGILLVAFAGLIGAWYWPSRREYGSLAVIGLSFTAVGFGGMFLGAGYLSSGIATVLANIQPLIASLLAYWFLNELITGRMLTGLLIGFGGVVILALPGMEPDTARLGGTLFVIVGAVGTAVGNVLLKRHSASGNLWLPMGLQLMIGSVFLTGGSIALGEDWLVHWNWEFGAVLFALSVPATALMIVLWHALLARAPLTQLNPFMFLTPAFGLFIGATFLGERFTLIELTGVAVTLAGLALIVLTRSPAAPGEKTATSSAEDHHQ